MNKEYWIPISLTSNDSRNRIKKAIKACHTVDTWTILRLQEQYIQRLKTPTNIEIQRDLTKFIREEGLLENAQRYSLNCAAVLAAEQFREQSKWKIDDQTMFPTPVPEESFTAIEIESRKIWKRYLELYGQLSTVYGPLLLEGDWKETLRQQAEDNKVRITKLPSLWKSITLTSVGDKYEITFNLGRKIPRRWTKAEEERMRNLLASGSSYRQVAKQLGRTSGAIERRYVHVLGNGKKKALSQKMVETNKKFRIDN